MWDELDIEVDKMCRSILPNNDLRHDLKQEVLMILFKKDGIEELFKEDKRKVFNLAIRIAYRQAKEGQQYFNKYILKPYKVVDYMGNWSTDADKENFNSKQSLITLKMSKLQEDKNLSIEELTSGLNELDRTWIDTYLRFNCTTLQMSNATKIYRESIDKRLESIYKKIRNNLK